jgi:dUTP pyrophosphatase
MEKLKQIHPEVADMKDPGCPEDYGLEPVNGHCPCHSCAECWNREIPEQETGPKLKVMLDPGAIMPTRAHSVDAGVDLFSREDAVIKSGESKTFDVGVHVEIPVGYVGMIKSKSGLNVKHGITSEGVIDAGYTGSIAVKLYNHGRFPVYIQKGEKISQLVILPIITPDLELVDSLEETERGTGGFGSTGKF